MWYKRQECGFRMALFFSAATLAGAFGGILARGIAEMSGVGGKAAWSWICMPLSSFDPWCKVANEGSYFGGLGEHSSQYGSALVHP